MDLALPQQSFGRAGTKIRWVPRARLPADIMTKSDVSRKNAALSDLLSSGRWKLHDESTEVDARVLESASLGARLTLRELHKVGNKAHMTMAMTLTTLIEDGSNMCWASGPVGMSDGVMILRRNIGHLDMC